MFHWLFIWACLKTRGVRLTLALAGLLVVGLGLYNQAQDYTIYDDLKAYYQDQASNQQLSMSYLRLYSELDEDMENYQAVYDNLYQQNRQLFAINQALSSGDLFIAPMERIYYELLGDPILEVNRIPRVMSRADQEARLVQAQYMEAHGISYLEEAYPVRTVLYPLQLSGLLFSLGTAFVVNLVFVLQLQVEITEGKWAWLTTLPLKKGRLLYAQSQLLAVYIGILILIFALSFVPSLVSGQVSSLLYPYVIQEDRGVVLRTVWQRILFTCLAWTFLVYLVHCILQVIRGLFSSIEQALLAWFLVGTSLIMASMAWPQALWNPVNYLVNPDPFVASSYFLFLPLVGLGVLGLLDGVLYQLGLYDRIVATLTVNAGQREAGSSLWALGGCLPNGVDFELKKVFRQQSHRYILLCIFFISLAGYTLIAFKSHHAQDEFQDLLLEQNANHQQALYQWNLIKVQSLYQMQAVYQAEFDQRQDPDQDFEAWFAQRDPGSYRNLTDAFHYHEGEIQNNNQILSSMEAGTLTPDALLTFREDRIQNNLTYLNPYQAGLDNPRWLASLEGLSGQIILERIQDLGLPPLLEARLLAIPYTGDPLEGQPRIAPVQVSDSTLYSAYLLIQQHGLPLLLVMLLLLWTGISNEFGSQKRIRWLQTVPGYTKRLYLYKLGANLLITLVLTVSLLLVFGVISFLIGGWGLGDYPVISFFSSLEGQGEAFMGRFTSPPVMYIDTRPLASYLWEALALWLASLAFVCSLFMFLSTLLPWTHMALVSTLFICGFGYYISWLHIEAPWALASPFLYLNHRETLDGWLRYLGNDPQLTARTGCLCLVLASLVLFGLGALLWWLGWGGRWPRKVENHAD